VIVIIKKVNDGLMRLFINITQSKIFEIISLAFGITFLMSFFHPAFADGVDALKDLGEAVDANFGTSSTFMKLLYTIEVFGSAYAYIKTKNLALLSGVVVLSLFVNFALQHWGIGA
jgi:hypothetical protein